MISLRLAHENEIVYIIVNDEKFVDVVNVSYCFNYESRDRVVVVIDERRE